MIKWRIFPLNLGQRPTSPVSEEEKEEKEEVDEVEEGEAQAGPSEGKHFMS